MRLFLVLVFLGLAVAAGAQQMRQLPSAAPVEREEAPTGFDDKSNGLVDDATHAADKEAFDEVETIEEGLGPLYNAQSCRECHQNPVSGGASQVTELRVGHRGPDGRFRNPRIPIARGTEVITDRSLVNDRAICPNGEFPDTEIQERVPVNETVRTFRISLNLLDDGFVEAVGITTRLFANEITKLCNTAPEPNNSPGPDGLDDLDKFARFMRATKAPARDMVRAVTREAERGSQLFDSVGCAICHVRALTTAATGTRINGGTFTIPPALGDKTFHPFGDFLLHDVGTGDGIVMAMEEHYGPDVYRRMKNVLARDFDSTQFKVRTAPLWSVRLRPRLMHDGETLTLLDAIRRHAGEASGVTARFNRLSRRDRNALLEFLRSL